MKPENRGSLLNRSFRKSFRRKKPEEPKKTAAEIEQEEKNLLSELRKAVSDVLSPDMDNDLFLRRCLKAKDSNLKEAEKLARLTVNYRKILRTDLYVKECNIPQIEKNYTATGTVGFDKDGDLVRIMNTGQMDIRGLVHSLSTINIIKIILWFLDQDEKAILEANKRTGKNGSQVIHIVDLDGLTAHQVMYKPVIDTALLGLKLMQEYYYDFIKTVYIINAPAIFSSFYKLIKPAIQENLQKRIKIFGYDDWKNPLLESIGPNILPKHLGGNLVDANNDPKCSAFIGQGGTIPEIYHSKPENFLDNELPGVELVTVPAGSSVNIPVEIKEAGSMMKWHLTGKDNDIGIGIYYEPAVDGENEEGDGAKAETEELIAAKKKADQKEVMEKLEPLTPIIRSQCQISPEIGYTTVWKAGKYIFHLDNTYSWMNPKQVLYKLEIVPPSEQYTSNDDKLIESMKNL